MIQIPLFIAVCGGTHATSSQLAKDYTCHHTKSGAQRAGGRAGVQCGNRRGMQAAAKAFLFRKHFLGEAIVPTPGWWAARLLQLRQI